ncbi:MAG: glycosyltransferase [Massilibacteroides sp.]|nr:glycosyltransferase [Massilibacteroides sp.]
MVQQSNKNFIWLCLFDLDTPAHYKHKFDRYSKCCPQFKPVCLALNQDENRPQIIKEAIQTYIDPKSTYLLTTNLDHYDSIHKDMIQYLQKHVLQNKEEGLYNFFHGFQFFVNTDLVIETYHPHNRFQSLFVKNESGLQNINYFCQTQIHHLFKTIEICLVQPMWLEVVHSDQKRNGLKLTSKIRNSCPKKSLDLSDYGLYFKLSTKKCYYNAYIIYPQLFIKTIIAKLKKKRLMLLNIV